MLAVQRVADESGIRHGGHAIGQIHSKVESRLSFRAVWVGIQARILMNAASSNGRPNACRKFARRRLQ